MKLKIYQVDSFASQAFQGNPAGVCITEEPLDQKLMLSIAAEMSVSETAFLSLSNNTLKWFTPTTEVELCGHGTLAVAHIMKERQLLKVGQSFVFNTLSGELEVFIRENDIAMTFPAPKLEQNCSLDQKLIEYLGIRDGEIKAVVSFESKLIIELNSEEQLLRLQPNYSGLLDCEGRGIAVTSASSSQTIDYSARYFGPWVGINEDPVTGSAHCGLGVYWQNILGKSELHAYQASERGGYLKLEMLPNNRVKLIGTAVTTLDAVMTC